MIRYGIHFRPLVAGLLVGTMAFGAAACSGGGSSQAEQDQEKKTQVVQKSRIEKLSEELEMSQEAIEAFQAAQAELAKKKPDFQKAQTDLQKAVELEPQFAEAHYNLGIVYTDLDRPQKALPHLEKAHNLDPGILNYTVALAQAYASAEQYSKARGMFQEVVARQPNNLTARNNLAAMALRDGDDEQALEHVRDVLREDNENVGALNILGLIYRKRGNLSLAKYAFQKGIRVSNKSVNGDDEKEDEEGDEEAKDDKAEQKKAQKGKEGKDGESAKQADKGEQNSEEQADEEEDEGKVSKDTADLHNNLGLVFLKEDDIPSAVDHFTAAIYADPNYLESRLNLGSILLEYLDYKRSFKQFSEAVRIAPNNCVARLGLGASAYAVQKFENSAKNYQYYVDKCDADHLSSYQRLAKIYETKIKDLPKSIAYYKQVRALAQDKETKAEAEAQIRFLQKQVESEEPKQPEQGEQGEEAQPAEGQDGAEGEDAEQPAEGQDSAGGSDTEQPEDGGAEEGGETAE